MSSPGVVAGPEPAKKEFSWKRLFIKVAGFGAGFALMSAILVGVFIWYVNRPKPPKEWDHSSITAEYDYLQVLTKNKHISFGYILVNHTNQDFRIESKDGLIYAIKLKQQNALSTIPSNVDAFTVDFPIIIPAHQRIYLDLEASITYKEASNNELPLEERRKFRKEVEEFLRPKYQNSSRFQSMFDPHN